MPRKCADRLKEKLRRRVKSLLATPRQQTGQENRRAQYGEHGNRIAPHGAGALHGFAAGDAGEPGALFRRIAAPIRHEFAKIGSHIPGPAIIAEDETTTIVPKSFAARLSPIGAILLEKVGP